MKRNVGIILSVVFIGFLVWYFAVKPHDYRITFTTKANVGTINQTLKLWHLNFKDSVDLKQNSLNHLQQTLKTTEKNITYNWHITSLDTAKTKVKVFVTDANNSFYNRLTAPFWNTKFKTNSIQHVKDFTETLQNHLKEFKVTSLGESQPKSTYCAYVSITTSQITKAKGMMQSFSFLDSFILKHNLTSNGSPFIQVTNWNQNTDSLTYNFCFPIKQPNQVLSHPKVKFKYFKAPKALKAIYNGNYITSDRAWYTLLDAAKTKNIKVKPTPIEVFNTNPNFGGDELQWNAEIYMPIIEE